MLSLFGAGSWQIILGDKNVSDFRRKLPDFNEGHLSVSSFHFPVYIYLKKTELRGVEDGAWFRDKKAMVLFVHTASLKASPGVEGSRQNKSLLYNIKACIFCFGLGKIMTYSQTGRGSFRWVALDNSARYKAWTANEYLSHLL